MLPTIFVIAGALALGLVRRKAGADGRGPAVGLTVCDLLGEAAALF